MTIINIRFQVNLLIDQKIQIAVYSSSGGGAPPQNYSVSSTTHSSSGGGAPPLSGAPMSAPAPVSAAPFTTAAPPPASGGGAPFGGGQRLGPTTPFRGRGVLKQLHDMPRIPVCEDCHREIRCVESLNQCIRYFE